MRYKQQLLLSVLVLVVVGVGIGVGGCADNNYVSLPRDACVRGPRELAYSSEVVAAGGDIRFDAIGSAIVGSDLPDLGKFVKLTPRAGGVWEARFEHDTRGTQIGRLAACPPRMMPR